MADRDTLAVAAEPNWFDRLIQKGIGMLPTETGLFSSAARPTNERLFIETVGKGRKDTITEADFTPDEIFALQNIVKENLKKQYNELQHDITYNQYVSQNTNDPQRKEIALQRLGEAKLKLDNFLKNPKGSVNYGEYKGAGDTVDVTAGKTPEGSLKTTLGRFSYVVDPRTNMINITDSYKFNTYKHWDKMGVEQTAGNKAESLGAGNVYPIIRDAAGRLLPTSQGIPVRMSLEYVDPFGDTTR